MTDENRLVAGIELGGTKSIALIARGRNIVEIARMPTAEPGATLEALSAQLDGWQGVHGQVEAIGIGSFGPIGLDRTRADYGCITSTPKPGWSDVNLVGHFARRFAVPIGFDTDVAGAALAEYRWGAAQGCDVVLYLTIGTGIGGGVVVGGVPVHGLVHPELGHLRVRRSAGDDFAGICPFHGDCLEGLASGPAIAARAGMAGADIGDDHPIWSAVGDELAEAMAMLMLTLSPQRILIGGGVPQHRWPLFDHVRTRAAELLAGYVVGVGEKELGEIIRAPGLGDMAGPLGAVALAYGS
ncbi:MAG: ROK family protein [Rhizorhabdus sp.]